MRRLQVATGHQAQPPRIVDPEDANGNAGEADPNGGDLALMQRCSRQSDGAEVARIGRPQCLQHSLGDVGEYLTRVERLAEALSPASR